MGIWSYDSKKFHDKKGRRWHFMQYYSFPKNLDYDDCPYALYFRDDERTVFGVLRFKRVKDNPYRDYAAVTRKIMNNAEFRETLLDEDSREVWK